MRKGMIVMSDPLFNSTRDNVTLSDTHGISTVEADQIDITSIGITATETPGALQSLVLNQEVTSLPSLAASALEVLELAELINYCIKEITLYQDGELQHEVYCIELLRRATLQGNQSAWISLQGLLGETVRGWVSEHPRKEEACSLESEETYVDLAFARFYLLIVSKQKEFNHLSAALQYLKVCLNGVIQERLRACSRTRAIPLQTPGATGELTVVHATDNAILWNVLCQLCKSTREERLAYLLFQCGLKPRDIVNCYPQEFHDISEITRVRNAILEQLLYHVDWQDE